MEMPTRLQMLSAAIEINKHGGAIKNPRFSSTSSLKDKLLEAVVDDWEKLSDETMNVLLALGANVPMPEDSLPKDLTSRKALEIAAMDMNTVMGLEPGIDLALPDDEFFNVFAKATKIAAGTDEFSDFTWAVLEANKLGPKRVMMENTHVESIGEAVVSNKQEVDEEASKDVVSNHPVDDKKQKKRRKRIEKSVIQDTKHTVISVVCNFLASRYETDGKEFSKEDLLSKLVNEFPDKREESMRTTVRYLLTCKKGLQSKGYQFERIDNNNMRILQIPA